MISTLLVGDVKPGERARALRPGASSALVMDILRVGDEVTCGYECVMEDGRE